MCRSRRHARCACASGSLDEESRSSVLSGSSVVDAGSTRSHYRGWEGLTHDPKAWQVDSRKRISLRPGIGVLVYHRAITPSHLWPVPVSPAP
jgi:hypothetical protein